MKYGLCPLSVVCCYEAPDSGSRLVSQFLYGESFKILEERKHWCKTRHSIDGIEAWTPRDQIHYIEQALYDLLSDKPGQLCSDLVCSISTQEGLLVPVLLGASLSAASHMNHQSASDTEKPAKEDSNLVDIALLYLNSPELRGGRSPFGIDSGGFVQMVYLQKGIYLKRFPHQQATQGEALSFIEESEPGDLAFFDNKEGEIDHVGIILSDNYIIHVSGQVRIDRIDHTGIFNNEKRRYTHPLRVIKKIT